MSFEAKIVAKPNIIRRNVISRSILLNPKSNRLLTLNEQAADIWDCLNDSIAYSESEIARILARKYPNTTKELIKKDVHDFLEKLRETGFINMDGAYQEKNFSSAEKKSEPLSHLSFVEQSHQLAAEKNIPISGCLEITQQCHLRCIHCYIDHNPIPLAKELSTEKFCRILDQMAQEGCLWLLITGGEPLLRKDFCDIYQYAKELGMIITVFTSATVLTDRIINKFTEYPPFLVEATLHGVKQETFEIISGVPGSFNKFRQGIRLLRGSKVPFNLKMIVMKHNFKEVSYAYEFALDLGAEDFRFDPMVNVDFLHSEKAKALRVSPREVIKIDLKEPYLERWRKIFRTALVKQKKFLFPKKRFLFPCRAGKSSFTISADGQLLPCVLMRQPFYNLEKTTFKEGWGKLNRFTTSTIMKSYNSCLKCTAKTCPRCPAWGYLEHGNPNSKSQFACSLQIEREKTFLS